MHSSIYLTLLYLQTTLKPFPSLRVSLTPSYQDPVTLEPFPPPRMSLTPSYQDSVTRKPFPPPQVVLMPCCLVRMTLQLVHSFWMTVTAPHPVQEIHKPILHTCLLHTLTGI